MTRAAAPLPKLNRPVTVPATLPGLPRGPMSPEQQLEALQKVQAQAEQRVKLGLQLFKAAEAHTLQHRQILDEVKAEQAKFRDELTQDVTRSLHEYDQWVGQIDDTVSDSIKALEAKMDQLTGEWAKTQQRIESMMRRSEALLDQSRCLVESQAATPAAPAPRAPTFVAPAEPAVIEPSPPGVVEEVIVAAPQVSSTDPIGEITTVDPPAESAAEEEEAPPIYSHVLAKLHQHTDHPPAA